MPHLSSIVYHMKMITGIKWKATEMQRTCIFVGLDISHKCQQRLFKSLLLRRHFVHQVYHICLCSPLTFPLSAHDVSRKRAMISTQRIRGSIGLSLWKQRGREISLSTTAASNYPYRVGSDCHMIRRQGSILWRTIQRKSAYFTHSVMQRIWNHRLCNVPSPSYCGDVAARYYWRNHRPDIELQIYFTTDVNSKSSQSGLNSPSRERDRMECEKLVQQDKIKWAFNEKNKFFKFSEWL